MLGEIQKFLLEICTLSAWFASWFGYFFKDISENLQPSTPSYATCSNKQKS